MSLKFTADQVRDREAGMIGRGTKPNDWWAWKQGSDCMAAQSYALGIRTNRASTTSSEISIAAFRAHYGWLTVPMSEARAGDLAAEFWPEPGQPILDVPNHIEHIYSINRAAGTITTDSGNTGPRPGQDDPRGFYRKTRTLGPNFLFAFRPPYAGSAETSPYGVKPPTGAGARDVKLVAAYLNAWGREKHPNLHTTTASKDGNSSDAPNYWTLVQMWGHDHNLYGHGYTIDGIPGARSRQVEAIILKTAKAAKK